MKVLLVPNYNNSEAIQSALSLERWLERGGVEVAWASDNRLEIKTPPEALEGTDLLISMGGDGTLLRAVRILDGKELPILGLSYGHVGFLTAASPVEQDILTVVSDALAGEMHISRRAMLSCDVNYTNSDGTVGQVTLQGLNDVALTHGVLSEIIEFDITVSGHHIDRLRGDGVVVSTATGSTGYALSAGGPIVSPDYNGLVCVPIAPHTIQARAFLTSPSDIVEITLSHERTSSPGIFVDGCSFRAEGRLDCISVRRAASDVLLLDYGPESFYNSVSRVFYGVRRND